MLDFTKHVGTRLRHLVTPQAEPIPGSAQVPNSDSGYAWPVDKWAHLDRFLILGCESGTYYASAQTLTREHAMNVLSLIADQGEAVVQRTCEVSRSGRAPKNDPAIFVLAICASLS